MVEKATDLNMNEKVKVRENAGSAKRKNRNIIEEGLKNIQDEEVKVKEIKEGNPGEVVVELCNKTFKEKYLESNNLILSPSDLKKIN